MTDRLRLDRALAGAAERLLTPFLIVDLGAVDHNARSMIARVGAQPDRWRPHVKTVKQSRVIAALLDTGVRNFKCATLDELVLILDVAAGKAALDAVDVLWAYPAHAASLDALTRRLDARSGRGSSNVSLLANDLSHLEWLEAHAPAGLGVMPDVDLGMGRTGRAPDHWFEAARVWPALERLRLVGLHGYDGHHRWDQRAAAHQSYAVLRELSDTLRAFAPAPLDVVTSGTHSFGHALEFDFGDSVRHQVSPGTIVLSDLRSAPAVAELGLRQAAFVASRVISTAPGRITLDAGSKAMSPDGPPPSCTVLGLEGLSPQTPSEEHLPVSVTPELAGRAPDFGAMLYLVPSHVCTTVNLHRRVVYVRDGAFVGIGDIEATGHPLTVGPEPAATATGVST